MQSRYVDCMQADATLRNPTDGNSDASERPADDQIAYTIPHAARVLDLGVRTVWAMVYSGAIDSFKIGKSRRITRAALVQYVDSLQRDVA